MTPKPVLISSVAQREIDEAASFFEGRREGLGFEFLERVGEAVESIERAPLGYAMRYKGLRRCGLRQFTDWALWFRILEDNSVVVACLSDRRSPKLVRDRARGVIPMPRPRDPS